MGDNCILAPDLDNLNEIIFNEVKSGDMVLTMGAVVFGDTATFLQ